MTALYLLEPDPPGAAWAPFAGVRPIAELRAGAWRIRERWEAACDAEAAAILGSHVEQFHEGDEPPVKPPAAVDGPAVVAAAWFAPTGDRLALDGGIRRLRHRGSTVGWVVPEGERWEGPHERGDALEVDGLPLRGSFDLLTALERFLAEDCADFRAAPSTGVPQGSIVLGDPADVDRDGRGGRAGGRVRRAAGGDRARAGRGGAPRHPARRAGLRGRGLQGARRVHPRLGIRSRVPGPWRDRGERRSWASPTRATTASWATAWWAIGSTSAPCTTTSNLKNTYGPVRLEIAGLRIETGRQNLGTLFGDHAKTAIGTMLATGTVICAGASVFGPPTPPKYVPPFAWGGAGGERLTADGFLARRRAGHAPARVSSSPPERRRSLERTFARGIDADDAAVRAGLGLARQLLRGRVGGRRASCSTRASARARSSAGRTMAGLDLESGRRHRAHPRARRPRLRGAAAGPPAGGAGAHGGRYLESARPRPGRGGPPGGHLPRPWSSGGKGGGEGEGEERRGGGGKRGGGPGGGGGGGGRGEERGATPGSGRREHRHRQPAGQPRRPAGVVAVLVRQRDPGDPTRSSPAWSARARSRAR